MTKIKRRYWYVIIAAFGMSTFVAIIVGLALSSPKITCNRTVPAPNAIVALQKNAADPSVLSVPVASYIQFNSCDGRPHDIGEGQGDDTYHQAAHKDEHDHAKGGLESGVFAANQGYRLTFKQAGVYHFHDHLNPKITITVVAYDPNVK